LASVHADTIRPADDAAGDCRHEPEDGDAGNPGPHRLPRGADFQYHDLGLQIALFATIGVGTPVWLMVAQTFCFGFFSSLQYTSMNTLVYADVTEAETSSASSIAATMQQMAISFGVATASLATASLFRIASIRTRRK